MLFQFLTQPHWWSGSSSVEHIKKRYPLRNNNYVDDNIKSNYNDNKICHLVSLYCAPGTGWSTLPTIITSISQMRKLKQRKLIICPDSWDFNPVLFHSRAHTVNYTMNRTWGPTRGAYVVHYPHPHQSPVKRRRNALPPFLRKLVKQATSWEIYICWNFTVTLDSAERNPVISDCRVFI